MKLKALPLFLAVTVLAACLSSSQAPESASKTETESDVHWSYSGSTGPENWAQLDPEFLVCSQGVRQSPIDLEAEPEQAYPDPQLRLTESRPHLSNNGHTIEVSLAETQALNLEGQEYSLAQFHFHAPSEHSVAGEAFPLEVHFVFRSGEQLAVLGVLVAEGEEHEVLASFWSDLPRNEGEQGHLGILIDPAKLFPEERSQFRYPGSLTTPPCSEGVKWVVFRQPLEMSSDQIESIAGILGDNNRPRQSLAGRTVTLDLADPG